MGERPPSISGRQPRQPLHQGARRRPATWAFHAGGAIGRDGLRDLRVIDGHHMAQQAASSWLGLAQVPADRSADCRRRRWVRAPAATITELCGWAEGSSAAPRVLAGFHQA